MARLSRQAGEEGAERRRVEGEKKELQEKLVNIIAELEKTRQQLANSDAKVSFDYFFPVNFRFLLR